MFSYLLLVSIIFGIVESEDPIVEIANGKVKGEILFTPNNRSFYSFRGIPYAKPPIGDLRFQPPQKPDNWTGILDSDAKDRICIQLYPKSALHENEDCLYIHVYTPQLPTENINVSLPVMYIIHGGGFTVGTPTPEELGPQYLMDYDIVFVSVGYRIGFLGFLSTEDHNCPGNNGFKDQQFGLRWVQENIRRFGGDPSRVTIFGESAGAVSVGLQLLAEKSEGLFIGAIQDSGSSLANWAIQDNPKKLAYEFAKQIDSTISENNTSTSELMTIFRGLSISQIKEASVALFGDGFLPNFHQLYMGHLFTGVIEPQHDGAFLTGSPFQKLTKGNFSLVPTLLGVNSEECLFLSRGDYLEETLAKFEKNIELYTCSDMHITDVETKKVAGERIRNLYNLTDSSPLKKGNFLGFFSDAAFVRGSIKQAQIQSAFTDVYFYEFVYSGQLGRRFNFPDIPGAGKVAHAEEMMYLVHRDDAKDIHSFPEEDITTMKRMLTMWTNFVKYQNPTPDPLEILQNTSWPRIGSVDEMPYLLINKTLEVEFNHKKIMMDGYKKVYDEYAVPPLVTY